MKYRFEKELWHTLRFIDMLTISSISKHHFVVLSLVVLDRFDQIVHRSRPEPLSILQGE